VFVVAGTQSGKTTFGPWWIWREQKTCGPGDYLIATATYDLFKLKLLPEMISVFCNTLQAEGWQYKASDRIITNGETRLILRSANVPEGLESATAKAAWLDECGQDTFQLASWEAVQRRLSLSQGRVLGTTTPYNLGWLKTQVYDRWNAGDKDYQVIQFKSTMNPTFPIEEYERARATLPDWKFNMFYNGEFTRPAGLIYDSFDFDRHKISLFEIPPHWAKYGGLDFGGVHTAAVCYAEDPDTNVLYCTREYLQGGRTAKEHAAELKTWGCRLWVGGSSSEGQWRQEFASAGLPIVEPLITDVEVGIDRVYGLHKTNGLYVFDTLAKYLDEKGRYSRELDQSGQPTENIKDKATFHLMDAERYIIGFIRGGSVTLTSQPTSKSKWTEREPATDDGKEDVMRWRKY
jgi:hypothetical protein